MYARIILVVLLLNAVRRSEGEAGGITSEDTIGAGDTAARSESAGKNNGEAEAVETSEDRTEEGRNGAVETVAGSKGETAAQGAKNGVAPGGSNDACVTQKHADESGSAGDAGKKTEGHLVNCQTIANSAMDKFIKQSPNAGNNELSTPPLECHSFAVDLSKGPHKDFKAFCKFVTYDVKNPKDMREHLTKLNGTEFSRLAYLKKDTKAFGCSCVRSPTKGVKKTVVCCLQCKNDEPCDGKTKQAHEVRGLNNPHVDDFLRKAGTPQLS